VHPASSSPTLLRSVLAGALLAGLTILVGAEKEPPDAPPKLISTTGGGPKWKNLPELRQFAAKGDPKACFELAGRFAEGNGVAKDFVQAKALYEQATKGGVADAWFRLGKLHHDGLGVPQDYAEALRCYLEAARGGVAEAQYNIGAMLVSARGVKRNYVEGLAWVIVATKSGASAAGEKQVRERLAGRVKEIAAAEARAIEIWQDVAAATVRGTFLDVPAPAKEVPAPPQLPPLPVELTTPAKPAVALPKLDVPPPKIAVPVAPLPALSPDGKP
jgi:uncharacterized protein